MAVDDKKRTVVMFSGGLTSWAAAKRVAEAGGTESMTLLFADTLIEDEDLYRFLGEAADNVGAELVRIADGRTPWEVFFAERFLGNHWIDPCSKLLKRKQLDGWFKANCEPGSTLVYGFDWTEGHRLERLLKYPSPYRRIAPLLSAPYLTRAALLESVRAEGLRPPRLYELGFQHNNCGGACVKAGQAAWAHLLRTMPSRFHSWEENEARFRREVRSDATILTDRSGGDRTPLTLREFRERIEAGGQYDMFEWGSCGCFVVPEMEVSNAQDLSTIEAAV